jgi:hypothetical protein
MVNVRIEARELTAEGSEVEAGESYLNIRSQTPSFSDEDADSLPRPWERPGARRRDCDPHRGLLLLILAHASLVCGYLGCVLLFPVIPGIILGTVGYMLARADQERMRLGLMDHNGMKEAQKAELLSAIGLWLNLIPCFFGVVIWLIIVLA